MKKGLLFLSLIILVTASLGAQGFNYQTVLRNGAGEILTNESVNVKFDILQGSETGIIVYTEEHAGATSSAYGVLNLIVGDGTPTSGTFAGIDWSNGPYFLKVTLGTDVMGASKFNSVPFSSYASKAGMADKTSDLDISGATSGDLLYFDGANWTRLAKGTDDQVLTLKSGTPSWETAASTGTDPVVKLPMLGEVYDGGVIVAIYPDTSVLVVKDEVIMDGAFNTVLDYATATASLPVGYRMPTHQEMEAIKTSAIHLTLVWQLDASFWTSSDHPTAANTKYMYVVGTGLYNGGDISVPFGTGAGEVIAVKKVNYQP